MEQQQRQYIRMVPCLCNSTASGYDFEFSDEFIQLYQLVYGDAEFSDERTDEKIIAIYNTLGEYRSAAKGKRIILCYIPEELKEYYVIKHYNMPEYQPFEQIQINYDKALANIALNVRKSDKYLAKDRKAIDRILFIQDHFEEMEYCECAI
jgi:hypothetical protein